METQLIEEPMPSELAGLRQEQRTVGTTGGRRAAPVITFGDERIAVRLCATPGPSGATHGVACAQSDRGRQAAEFRPQPTATLAAWPITIARACGGDVSGAGFLQ
jgi:hypothetical protein